ncbi:unnamed protein product [Durusdinium trenchii]|uniref:Uncharacterized protein n=1 Tax=Durusdinium trenchii TaxID=1381693 RepID=A0ABP0SY94_9DINO
MRDTILLLLCGRAPADVPGQDQLCEPLEDLSVLMQLSVKNGFAAPKVAWMKSVGRGITGSCTFNVPTPLESHSPHPILIVMATMVAFARLQRSRTTTGKTPPHASRHRRPRAAEL